jgi:dTDP-4-dehydrorhamnose reductase
MLVTGGSGHLGGELLRRSAAAGWRAYGTWHTRAMDGPQLDIRDAAAVDDLVRRIGPQVVVHTAYRPSGADMHDVNVIGAVHVARSARKAGARMVHISTDVVFDGRRDRAYTEGDPPSPIIEYGRSKLAAEQAVRAADPDALILRTSLLYGGDPARGHDRVVLDALDGKIDMAFFTDELRCPVHVQDLAGVVLELAHSRRCGVLHAAGADVVSRFEFARHVAAAHGRDPALVRAASSASEPVRRPLNCALDSSRLAGICSARLRGVREVLAAADLH